MKYYIEITLLPGGEIGLYFLWQKVYQQIHIAFAGIKNENDSIPIGVSFPEYNVEKNQLGKKLRLFATNKKVFESLNIRDKLVRFLDYVHITSIKEVPEKIHSFAVFKRQQVKSSIARLARRKAKREGIEVEQALAALAGFEEKRVKTPFINMESLSSRQVDTQANSPKFPLFILKLPVNQPQEGCFNCYGLSDKTTIPCF